MARRVEPWKLCGAVAILLALAGSARAEDADLILHHGKIATVDKQFSIAEAIAVRGGKIVAVGPNADVLKLKGANTDAVDLGGKLLIPGLIDSHVHPGSAAMTEFDHPIPDMQSIDDVLAYIKTRAEALGEGKWVEVHQVFITRLAEQRYPTRAELDRVAPKNPVVFATGPDASLNTLALEKSGIDRDFVVTGRGFIEKDAAGEPTGILRSCTRVVKSESNGKRASDEVRLERLQALLADYNSVGITSIADRDASGDGIDHYRALLAGNRLTTRVSISHHVDTEGDLESIQKKIRQVGAHPLHKPDPMLQIVGIKTYLDGGMLTGSAYMREPWGVSQIYSIRDPKYRGVLFIPPEKLLPIVETTVDEGLQFTAHSVGDGAVHQLLDVYDQIATKNSALAKTRPCITHSNFMSREAVEKAARLHVVVDIQPAWLYLDTRTLVAQFGYDRLRYFQPLKSIFELGGVAGGGSDHMQKIGSLRSINPYNPFLGMQTTITRRGKGYEGQLHPEEALSREQALCFYTLNNAIVIHRDHEVGSLEVGKLADFALLDTDLLECPADKIRDTQVLGTWLGGRKIYPPIAK